MILYLLQDAGYLSRMVFVSFWILYTAVSYLCRIQWKRYVQKHLSEKGIRSFVIVTSSDLAEQVVKRIKGNNYYGLKLTGVILMDQSMTGWSYEGVPVVADAETAEEYLCREWVDEVFFNLPEEIELPTELINLCEEMGLTVHLRMAQNRRFPEHQPVCTEAGRLYGHHKLCQRPVRRPGDSETPDGYRRRSGRMYPDRNPFPVCGAGDLSEISGTDFLLPVENRKERKKIQNIQIPKHVYGCGGTEKEADGAEQNKRRHDV